MLETTGSLASSWDAEEGEVEGDQCDGKDGCRQARSMNAPRGPSQTLQYAREGQYATIRSQKATQELTYPFCLLGFLLFGHLVANAVRVPECPYRQLVEDTDLGENIEIQELVGFFIVAEGIGFIGCFRIILASGVLIEIVESANTVASVEPPRVARKGLQYTYVRPRCDEIHLRRHNPISSSLWEGSGLRHSTSRS